MAFSNQFGSSGASLSVESRSARLAAGVGAVLLLELLRLPDDVVVRGPGVGHRLACPGELRGRPVQSRLRVLQLRVVRERPARELEVGVRGGCLLLALRGLDLALRVLRVAVESPRPLLVAVERLLPVGQRGGRPGDGGVGVLQVRRQCPVELLAEGDAASPSQSPPERRFSIILWASEMVCADFCSRVVSSDTTGTLPGAGSKPRDG
jgi:hypothetical protein